MHSWRQVCKPSPHTSWSDAVSQDPGEAGRGQTGIIKPLPRTEKQQAALAFINTNTAERSQTGQQTPLRGAQRQLNGASSSETREICDPRARRNHADASLQNDWKTRAQKLKKGSAGLFLGRPALASVCGDRCSLLLFLCLGVVDRAGGSRNRPVCCRHTASPHCLSISASHPLLMLSSASLCLYPEQITF